MLDGEIINGIRKRLREISWGNELHPMAERYARQMYKLLKEEDDGLTLEDVMRSDTVRRYDRKLKGLE